MDSQYIKFKKAVVQTCWEIVLCCNLLKEFRKMIWNWLVTILTFIFAQALSRLCYVIIGYCVDLVRQSLLLQEIRAASNICLHPPIRYYIINNWFMASVSANVGVLVSVWVERYRISKIFFLNSLLYLQFSNKRNYYKKYLVI